MTAADKREQFVADTRQLVRDYMAIMERVDAIANENDGDWALLYSAIIEETDIPDTVIPPDGQTKLDALTTAIANLRAALAGYTGAVQTTFERVA